MLFVGGQRLNRFPEPTRQPMFAETVAATAVPAVASTDPKAKAATTLARFMTSP